MNHSEKLYARRAFRIIDGLFAGELTRLQANALMELCPPFTDKYAEIATRELMQEEKPCATTTP